MLIRLDPIQETPLIRLATSLCLFCLSLHRGESLFESVYLQLGLGLGLGLGLFESVYLALL